MNEKELHELIQSIDISLVEQELEDLTTDLEIDMDSISKKAYERLKKGKRKMKRRFLPIVAASLIVVAGVSSIYASDISDFVRSFFNKKEVYSTIVDGEAYYLEEPVALGDGSSIDEVIFTKNTLDMRLTYPTKDGIVPKVELVTNTGEVYTPGGYGYADDKKRELLFSFWNEEEGNYIFKPAKEVELILNGKGYAFTLTEGEQVIKEGEIIPPVDNIAEASSDKEEVTKTVIDWVNIGYKKIDGGISIVTSFDDKELKLSAIGTMKYNDVRTNFKNDRSGIIGGGTSSATLPLIGVNAENKEYLFVQDKNSALARPVTKYLAELPAGKSVELQVPSIMVKYEKRLIELDLDLPEDTDEVSFNKELDLKLQKMQLDSIKRTSPTTATLMFTLNTGDKREVEIREASVYSKDVKSAELNWNNGKCIMEAVFEEGTEKITLSVGWPEFVVNGDWKFVVE